MPKKRRVPSPYTGVVALVVGVASFGLAGVLGFSIASAGADMQVAGQPVGLDVEAAHIQQAKSQAAAYMFTGQASEAQGEEGLAEPVSIESAAPRDISAGIEAIEAQEEADRVAAEEQARATELLRIANAQKARAAQEEQSASEPVTATPMSELEPVDWSVGRDAFIAEWTERIDAYLAGTNLAGYGRTFATAAWDNSIDPRWSPAISNTESSNGKQCFLPFNAWGWGDHGWTNWEDAIAEHVSGLSAGYGYSLTLANAYKYCPPNYERWYYHTLGQMALI
ncbi:CMP-2-keto-3-deoxyoctulosonic acid synthetase [Eggerthellaceae bacterium zg-887]|uniref:CMP-2-keto-3-deoxyoctulosonic acid synthetase n=1 Tax=Xiamenia xianingshaonis TaxID=2682776 RepID=UPI00140AFE88|nr:CMP-2-keto-3-deoxyoctulosonic acid synthetase [Xiamenia xianingshaonis]NHM16297.1 CMP-2-keto-3-deoxyoctulosonic acid synthetase [Xiamenia xianingshaonis]